MSRGKRETSRGRKRRLTKTFPSKNAPEGNRRKRKKRAPEEARSEHSRTLLSWKKATQGERGEKRETKAWGKKGDRPTLKRLKSLEGQGQKACDLKGGGERAGGGGLA